MRYHFNFLGETYSLGFKHKIVTEIEHMKNKKLDAFQVSTRLVPGTGHTECHLYRHGKDIRTTLLTGFGRVHKGDMFSRALGRKHSVINLVKSLRNSEDVGFPITGARNRKRVEFLILATYNAEFPKTPIIDTDFDPKVPAKQVPKLPADVYKYLLQAEALATIYKMK